MFDIFSGLSSIGYSLILIVLGAVVLSKAVVIVPNRSAYIVERLGSYHATLMAGFHVLIPFFDRIAYRRSLKEQVIDVPKQSCITRDNVTVDIDGVLYLQVITPEKSAYGIDNYEWGAIQLAQTALRSAIGKLELDRTFEERSQINQEVIAALDSATSSWGIKVLRYEIRDITPPDSVMQAMEKQMRAEREKRAVIAQSEGERQSQINLAEGAREAAIAKSEGEKQALINQSEGEKQALINKAEGEAVQIRMVAQATAEGLEMVGKKLTCEGMAAAQLRLGEAYVAQFGELAKNTTTTIIPANIADAAGMLATLTSIWRSGKGLDTTKN